MKKFTLCFSVLALLVAAVPGTPRTPTLEFMGVFAQPSSGWLFWNGAEIRIGWKLRNGLGHERMIIDLLKDGAYLKTLIAGVPNKLANMGQADQNYLYNEYAWKPGPYDIGCHYQVKVNKEDYSLSITSAVFNIYPVFRYTKNGVNSYAQLDTPAGGSTLLLGKNYPIKWSANAAPAAWPSKQIHLKLLADINGSIVVVGDIADVAIDFSGCAIHGQYGWPVGTLVNIAHPEYKPDGKNNVLYRVRLTGDSSTYDSDDFKIGAIHVTPGSYIK
jgi:hypothetical protein